MRRTIAAATVAASITVGGLAGAALGAPGLAAAADSTASAAGWVHEALAGLVDDGTIDQAQADAVAAALQEARPDHGAGRGGPGRHLGPVVADALGITEDELRTARSEGQTIGEVAEARGVEPQVVIDAIVAAHQARLDEAVAAGDLTQERADELAARAAERAAAVVDGEVPAFGTGPGRGHHRFPGAGGDGGPGAAEEPGDEAEEGSAGS